MTVKNILIVGAVGLGAYFLVKQLAAPSKPSSATGNSQSAPVFLGNLLGGGIASFFGNLGLTTGASTQVPTSYYAPPGTIYSTDTQAQAGYALSHDVVDQQGNQLVDLNTGNALSFDVN